MKNTVIASGIALALLSPCQAQETGQAQTIEQTMFFIVTGQEDTNADPTLKVDANNCVMTRTSVLITEAYDFNKIIPSEMTLNDAPPEVANEHVLHDAAWPKGAVLHAT